MALLLHAVNNIEGKAFYEQNGRFYYIRPFYDSGDMQECDKKMIDIAISRDGYESIEKPFSNVVELVNFLREQYLELRKGQKLNYPTEKQLNSLVSTVNDDIFISYVSDAINKWIPSGNIEPAKLLLSDIMGVQNLTDRPKLYEAALKLKSALDKDTSVPIHRKKNELNDENQYLIIWKARFLTLVSEDENLNQYKDLPKIRVRNQMSLMTCHC